jgi:hypothetical protein
MDNRNVYVGSRVIYTDTHRVDHEALVTAAHGLPDKYQCINVVYVSDDAAKTDPYGRQIERASSATHVSMNSARAYCWRFLDEE